MDYSACDMLQNTALIAFFNQLLIIDQYTYWCSGFIFGFFAYIVFVGYRKRWQVVTAMAALIALATLFLTPLLSLVIRCYPIPPLSSWRLTGFGIEAVVGMIASFVAFRRATPLLNDWYCRLFKKHYEGLTDVRHIERHLPDQLAGYDPRPYFKSDQLLLGLKKKKVPLYLPYSLWISSHLQILGTTRAGKGVLLCLLFYQAIVNFKETSIYIDPKRDKWAVHVLKAAADTAGVPFLLIDLNADAPPQINLLQGTTAADIEALFAAGFGLSEKGLESDVYRLNDRYIASEAARIAAENTNYTLGDLYQTLLENSEDFHKNYLFFAGSLREMASLHSINSDAGIDIEAIIRQHGVIYVVGSMNNPRVVKAQKMLVFRIMQIAQKINAERETIFPIALCLDEFKYLISSITLQTLGASLGSGLHALLAHQSLHDLRGTSADLDADMVMGAVMDNTRIKISYRLEDPETAEQFARKSGTIPVESELKTYTKSAGLMLSGTGDARTQEVTRYHIDTNMLLHLSPGCAVIYGLPEGTQFVATSPVPVTINPNTLTPLPRGNSRAYRSQPPFQEQEEKTHTEAEQLIHVD